MSYHESIIKLLSCSTDQAGRDEEDRIWKSWLDKGTRKGVDDLRKLLVEKVRNEFKFRALVVLLAVDHRLLPFPWAGNSRSFNNYLYLPSLDFKTLPTELVRIAGELVCINIDFCTCGIEGAVPDCDVLRQAVAMYNNLILLLLAVLPEDDELAERLFSRYRINDIVPYSGLEECSGYKPLREILGTRDVPLRWKIGADRKMRERVLAEAQGRVSPRVAWEGALPCYVDHIQMVNYNGTEGYSRELFTDQIRFITELEGVENYRGDLFSPWQVGYIMEAIPGDALRATRHKLARLVVLRDTDDGCGFSVGNPESRRSADVMLREFAAEDSELAARLKALLMQATQCETQRVADQRAHRAAEDALLRQMM